MSINEAERVMVMGESGCGKSTLLKLLMRFYEKTEGNIRIFGKNIEDYSLMELRNMITYVPQNSYLFEGTVRENIEMGCSDDKVPAEEEIKAAAKAAYADEFIGEFPDGYEQHLDAGGTNLSGGQRQRIAIARAFLKNSPILLMDEPSSALDVESEKKINCAMKELMKGKVVIMVTHRATSFEDFNCVIKI